MLCSGPPCVITYGSEKIWKNPSIVVTATNRNVGPSIGTVTCTNRCTALVRLWFLTVLPAPASDFPAADPTVFAQALKARNRNDEVKLSGAKPE